MQRVLINKRSKWLKSRRAQSTLETAMIAVVLSAALVAMHIYIKRGLEGRFREATDSIGEQYSYRTNTGNTTKTETQNVTVLVDSILLNITNESGAVIDTREILVFNRTGNSTESQERNSWERTGTIDSEKLYE